ncbi:MAG: hypothetical protein FJZ62_02520 [Chlamydiae bacterium]|nr:hypothetical protein [Chlamydiota bacterium]
MNKLFFLLIFYFHWAQADLPQIYLGENPVKGKLTLYRFQNNPGFGSTHFIMDSFPNLTILRDSPIESRTFWGLDTTFQIPLSSTGNFSRWRWFCSKKKHRFMHYPDYLDREAICFYYDIDKSYSPKNILLTTAQDGYLFNQELLQSVFGSKIPLSKTLNLELTLGLDFTRFKQILTKKIGFLTLEHAPIEEIRNFNTSNFFRGGGPAFGSQIEYTPFPKNLFLKTLHFFSQIESGLVCGCSEITNNFFIKNGTKKIPLLQQNFFRLSQIPMVGFTLGVEFRPYLVFCDGSLDFSIFNQTWFKADRTYEGTKDYRGAENISLTGYALGIGLNF